MATHTYVLSELPSGQDSVQNRKNCPQNGLNGSKHALRLTEIPNAQSWHSSHSPSPSGLVKWLSCQLCTLVISVRLRESAHHFSKNRGFAAVFGKVVCRLSSSPEITTRKTGDFGIFSGLTHEFPAFATFETGLVVFTGYSRRFKE